MHRLCSLNNAGYLHFIEWWYTLFTYQLSGQTEYEEICERKDMALLIFHISPHPVGKAPAGWDVSCSAWFLHVHVSPRQKLLQNSWNTHCLPFLWTSSELMKNKSNNLPIREWIAKGHSLGKRNKPALKIPSCSLLGLLGDVVSLPTMPEGAREDFCCQEATCKAAAAC